MSNGHTFLCAYGMVSESLNRLVWNQPRSSLRFSHPNGVKDKCMKRRETMINYVVPSFPLCLDHDCLYSVRTVKGLPRCREVLENSSHPDCSSRLTQYRENRQDLTPLIKSTGFHNDRTLHIRGVLDRLRFLPIKKMDQRTCIKFCVINEIKCADAFRMLTVAYGEATLDRSNVYRWYKMFSEGREDANDEERAGRPSTSTTDEKINEEEKMILANRRITVREVTEDLNISIGSCHSIFINDLGMRRVAAKFVPKLLNCDQKQHCMNIANEMLDSVRDDPNLLQRVITGDVAWVYGYDVETKAQSSQWKLPHEPRPKKARQVRSNGKVLLTVFFDCRGVVHHEFLPQGRTVNKEYYLQVMRNLREAIRLKRPDLWKNKNWLLHHDNAPAHTSLLVRDLLAKNNTLMMPQPPYSPDLAPCDFFLFPKLKRPMKG
ncbi:hypothetical protein LAZ67_19002427 [Cordylochernes scorpioides]|uniref:Mos1 transposase HTH domain-containing protein n=1 Tax=Cordylochernes scorpioides TaxID=51811 RepID=A0ABY6LKR2_9ARAC|nr:hypothetical protein LAZ67_19002427 [Cordylochernes scorpioides]